MRPSGLVLLGIGLGASIGLTGCGGAGGPWGGSPLVDPPETELLVRLYYLAGCYTGGWDVAVHRDGRCRAHLRESEEGGPIGLFEVQLDEQQLASVRMTVREAASAGLKRRYPWHSYDPPWCSLYIWVRGKLRYTGYDPLYRRNPAPLKAFCRIEEVGYRSAMRGLLWEAFKHAESHPVSAVAVEVGQVGTVYRVGEPVPVAMALRSVGTYPVAVPTLDCQEVVSGECYVALWPAPSVNPPIEGPDSERSARRSFGGRQDLRIRDELSPEALADLDRFVILQPDETYAIPWSPTLSADRPGRHNLYGAYRTEPRYRLAAINEALSAPFADGVCSWTSAGIDIVK